MTRAVARGAAIVAIASMLAALASLAASCGGSGRGVGLFLYNEADPYIREFARQIIAESPPGQAPEKFDAANSQPLQNEQIEDVLGRSANGGKPSVLMVNPVDRFGAYAVIKRAKTEDVPVIFFNREPLVEDLALWDKTYYVGARAEQSGQLQAELVMDLFGGVPGRLNQFDRSGDGVIQAVIFKGEQGHQDAEIRTREVLRSFENHGFAVEVLAMEIANWNRDEAYVKAARLFRDVGDKIELVVSNNDAMALGAISAMRQAGIFKDTNGNDKADARDEGWIPVVGIDGLKEAEEAIADGYLYGTVRNDSLSMAKAMVALADELLGSTGDKTYSLTDGRYIWIDYRPFVSREAPDSEEFRK